MKAIFSNHAKKHLAAFEQSFSENQITVLESISREIIKAFKSGNRLLLCGNGGSAADSQHIAAEFVGRFNRERMSLPAIALTTDTSILTAIANDYDYDQIFKRQVEGLGNKNDVLIGISTSGNSKNVLLAVEKAKEKGLRTIGFTGEKGGKLKDQSDLCYCAQSTMTPHIQEIHIAALHAISEAVEEAFFGS